MEDLEIIKNDVLTKILDGATIGCDTVTGVIYAVKDGVRRNISNEIYELVVFSLSDEKNIKVTAFSREYEISIKQI